MIIKLPQKWYALVSLGLVAVAAAAGVLMSNEGVSGTVKLVVMVASTVAGVLLKSVAPEDPQ